MVPVTGTEVDVPERTGISVIVPCYNAGAYVWEAVRSVVRQPLDLDHEVVVVDDGSTDAATRSALGRCAALPRVRLVSHDSRQGHHAARNTGLRTARFDYVLQLDADDRLATDRDLLAGGSYPDRAVRILSDERDVAFVHTFSRMFGGFEGLTISSYPCREDLVVRKHHVPTPIVCRRSEALGCGMYDPRVTKWGDWAFAVNLLASRFRRSLRNRIACVSGPLHEYRIHAAGPRVSTSDVSESDMTFLVVERNLDYFRDRLGRADSAAALTRAVVAAKPSRLTDLLHMAAFDLPQALQVAHERTLTMHGRADDLGVP